MTDLFPSQSEPTDQELLAGICREDVSAFGHLYDRYARSIYVTAYHTLGHLDAEEAVQEIFLRIWQRAHQFDADRGLPYVWIHAIARNYVIDCLKRRGREGRHNSVDDIDELLANWADDGADVPDLVWRSERQAVIGQALGELPREQRQAILLAYFSGLSHSAIAAQLNWPLGTVKKRIRLGMQKLRSALQHRKEMMP